MNKLLYKYEIASIYVWIDVYSYLTVFESLEVWSGRGEFSFGFVSKIFIIHKDLL